MLTQKDVLDVLFYNPVTGDLVWEGRSRKSFSSYAAWEEWNEMYAGKIATRPHPSGYSTINFFSSTYYAHRIIFLYMTGYFPDVVDHLDGDSYNNTWKNLRATTQSMNCKNRVMPSSNTSGYTGVNFNKGNNMWYASLGSSGKTHNLGRFSTKEEAIKALLDVRSAFGFTERHGKSPEEDPFVVMGYKSKYDCLRKLSERFEVNLELVMDIAEEVGCGDNLDTLLTILDDLYVFSRSLDSAEGVGMSAHLKREDDELFWLAVENGI